MNVNVTMPDRSSPRVKQQFCMPEELRDRLRATATERGLSMSAFVVNLLEQVLPKQTPKQTKDTAI